MKIPVACEHASTLSANDSMQFATSHKRRVFDLQSTLILRWNSWLDITSRSYTSLSDVIYAENAQCCCANYCIYPRVIVNLLLFNGKHICCIEGDG